jgi:hypothetical protein
MSRIDCSYKKNKKTIRIGHTSTYNWNCIGVSRATNTTRENWTCECTKHGGNTLGWNQMPKKHGVHK